LRSDSAIPKKIHGWIFKSFLPNSIKPWMAAWQRAELQSNSAIIKKSMEGFFYVSYAAMEGPAAGWLPLGELVEPRQ
jgi:hypothetical protein